MRNCDRNAAGAHPRGLGRLFRSAALVEAARFSNRLGFERLAEAGKSIQPDSQPKCRMLWRKKAPVEIDRGFVLNSFQRLRPRARR